MCWLGSILGGCATPPTMRDTEDIAADSNVVFGSVDVIVDGEKEDWGVKFTGYNYFYLMILPPDTNEAITYRLADDGVFYWSLPAGEYTLLGYLWQDRQTQRSGRIDATFRVPDAATDAYLGSLEFHGSKFFLVPRMQDRFDDIKADYRREFPNRDVEVTKLLFEAPDPVGTFSNVTGPCNEMWAIECSDRFSGVTPVSPETGQSGFPESASLMPQFSWEPSSSTSVSYDFVIYEAASYALSGGMVTSYMRGRMITYAEDLKEPVWRLESPLKPDTRYLWSVRLRDQETVSAWSTQGHFTFMIVAMSSGFGQWFQFKTP